MLQYIYSHVTFDRVTEEALACQHLVLLSKCGITDHMYPPSNHRKSFFAAASYTASAGSACFYMYTHTNTHNTPTRSQKWALVALHPGKKHESETMIKRKLS